MSTQPKQFSSSRRRFRSFKLLGLLVVIAVIAGVLGWLAYPANVQRYAVSMIEESGGKVWYDWEWFDGLPNGRVTTVAEQWLTRGIGADYFGNVVRVSLDRRASDADLAYVRRLKRLERLDIDASSVTAAGLALLKPLPHLANLRLFRMTAGDRGLEQFAGVNRLRVLSLEESQISDAGAANLANLTGLVDLDLSGTAIGDVALKYVGGLTSLKRLNLSRTRVTSGGMVHLRGLIQLSDLILDRTAVGDEGLAHLHGLRQLAMLSLDQCKITDKGALEFQLRRAEQQSRFVGPVDAAGRILQFAPPNLEIMR
jgi:hypothetical protein